MLETARLIGIDAGATRAKLAARDPHGHLAFEAFAARDVDAVAQRVARLRPARVGLTGGGAALLRERIGSEAAGINEFAAWGAGARRLLSRERHEAPGRFMVVSLGTGTSVMLVDGLSTQRIGGTALGGGTVMGLGRLLCAVEGFDELCRLAERGDTRKVDLMVSDIYRPGESPLTGDITAANFGRLASGDVRRASAEHLAAGVMNLVAENVALVCGYLAAAAQVRELVFGGSTLCGNPTLVETLSSVTRAIGCEATVLEAGEFAGALGALELVDTPAAA